MLANAPKLVPLRYGTPYCDECRDTLRPGMRRLVARPDAGRHVPESRPLRRLPPWPSRDAPWSGAALIPALRPCIRCGKLNRGRSWRDFKPTVWKRDVGLTAEDMWAQALEAEKAGR